MVISEGDIQTLVARPLTQTNALPLKLLQTIPHFVAKIQEIESLPPALPYFHAEPFAVTFICQALGQIGSNLLVDVQTLRTAHRSFHG